MNYLVCIFELRRGGVGSGLALRLGNGSANCSEYFQREISCLGIAPSFSFVEEPQTNGVVEWFNRTLKEQAIYGCVFLTLDDVRKALLSFQQEYNRSWRLEKLGFKTPLEARHRYNERLLLAAA